MTNLSFQEDYLELNQVGILTDLDQNYVHIFYKDYCLLRILELIKEKENGKASLSEQSIEKLQHIFSSQTFDDEDIKDEIKLLNEKFEIVFDPHTVTSLRMALDTNTNLPTVAVATASPEKFSNVISPIIDDFSEVNIENDEDFMVLDVNKDNIVESIKAKFA